jgi:hypothetical protein
MESTLSFSRTHHPQLEEEKTSKTLKVNKKFMKIKKIQHLTQTSTYMWK